MERPMTALYADEGPALDGECFFISPIGQEGSPERIRSDAVLERIVGPAAADLGLQAVRGDRIAQPGEVTAQVIYHLSGARAAVADLTGRNPNVFYELAIRQSAGRPVVLIARVGEDLPFNIHTMRTIFYDEDDSASIETCSRELAEQIRNSFVVSDSEVANLVHQAYGQRVRTPPSYDIGCRIGRRSIECGILQVEVPTTGLPSSGEVHVADEISPVLSAESQGHQLWAVEKEGFLAEFHGAVAKLARAAANKGVQIRTIGVAVPGAARVEEGRFRFSTPVEGVAFEAGEPIAQNLAEHLCRGVGPDTIEQVFGASDRRRLEQQIHLDNDVRCASRWLATAHAGDPLWRDFCCVFVGSGVGSGLVLGGNVYYGSHQRAGEVGHVTLHLEKQLRVDGIELRPRLCSCGKRAFHFETLAGVGGLGHLGCAIDESKLAELRATLNPSTASQALSSSEWSIDAYDEAGFDILRAFRRRLHFHEEYEEYLTRVIDAYAGVFGIGVAALIDILDVGRVALCGAIPEFVQQNSDLRNKLSTLPGAALVEPAKIAFEWGSMADWGWRGAALLSRDPN